MSRTQSEHIFSQAKKVIPGGVNSPVRAFKGLGISPLIVQEGFGSHIFDADGKRYIDYCMSWGALILGHAHPKIVQAAQEQMAKGSTFGIATPIEEKIASKIVRLISSIEKVRFVSSGTEAVMTALRLARGFTAKTKIIKFAGHYHGHLDSLLVQAGSGAMSLNPVATSKGLPISSFNDTLVFPFNDAEKARLFFQTNPLAREVAAVIVEPIAGNMGVVPPLPLFLEMLREETKRVGALLIFDEVITGFRVGLQGAQGLYGIAPDLTCLGKIIGGGFPAAAIGGRGEILDHLAPLGQVYQAGTLSGNPVAMRAGLETIQILEEEDPYFTLLEKTKRLTLPIRERLLKKGVKGCIQEVGSMFCLFLGVDSVQEKTSLDEGLFAQFFRYLFERGIYIPPSAYESWFVSTSHTNEDIDYTVECIISFIDTYF